MRPQATSVWGLTLLVYEALSYYTDVCWRMLTHADACWRMLTYARQYWCAQATRACHTSSSPHTKTRPRDTSPQAINSGKIFFFCEFVLYAGRLLPCCEIPRHVAVPLQTAHVRTWKHSRLGSPTSIGFYWRCKSELRNFAGEANLWRTSLLALISNCFFLNGSEPLYWNKKNCGLKRNRLKHDLQKMLLD